VSAVVSAVVSAAGGACVPGAYIHGILYRLQSALSTQLNYKHTCTHTVDCEAHTSAIAILQIITQNCIHNTHTTIRIIMDVTVYIKCYK
jgi:hypothetical protein